LAALSVCQEIQNKALLAIISKNMYNAEHKKLNFFTCSPIKKEKKM
jgi:hypothetical protein